MIPYPGVRLILFGLLIYSFSIPLFSQRNFNTFQVLTTEDGLSGNVIYSLYQDKKGFLWIGTNEGLNLYDGYTFKVFRHQPGDTTSIPSNRVIKFFEDSLGHLWIYTYSGLSRYNPMDQSFSHSYLPAQSNIFYCMLDEQYSLIAYDYKIQLFDHWKKTKTPVIKSKTTSPHINYNLNYATDASGRIFLAGIDKEVLRVWQYHKESNHLSMFREIPLGIQHQSRILSSFFIDSSDRFWYNISNDILMCPANAPAGKDKPQIIWSGENEMAAIQFYEDKDGNIWICTTERLVKVDRSLQLHFYSDTTFPNALSSKNINCVFQDNSGVIWIGTFNGLNKLNPAAHLFQHLEHDARSNQSIQSNAVFGIYQQDEDKVRINYLFGASIFSVLDLTTEKYTHYQLSTQDPAFNLSHIALNNPMHLEASSIPLLKTNMSQPIFRNHKIPGNMYVDEQQNFWFNYQDKLILVNTMQSWELGTFMFDMHSYDQELSITTDSGLMILNKDTQKFLNGDRGHFLGGKFGPFMCQLAEENGDLWLASKGKGLIYFSRKEKTFQQYDADEGLCHESIYSITKDKNGRLWLGTANGLSCFDPNAKTFRNYFPTDGIMNTEYNRSSALTLSNGTIYMGGMNGIDIFHPDQLPFERAAPRVSITDFRVHNQRISLSQHVLPLHHNDNNINITFAVMDFQHPPLNKFRYMLEGADREWTVTRNPQTSYASLAPGHYQFIIYGANSNGTWSSSPARISFMIRLPWWNRWWFYSASALFAIGFLYALYSYRLRHLEKIYSIRNEISQDLHDQVGATLTSISFLSEVAKQQSAEDDIAKETLNKIGDYSREMIGEMNDIVWSINPANDKFDNIGERMQNYASPLLAAKNIKFDFSSDLHLKNITLTPQQRKNLYLIFKEAVNNAAKYSQGNHITVSLERRSGNLMMKVADDGKGFVPDNGEIGNGLTNMKMRAAAVKGQLSILSTKDSGTKIILEMPITQNAYVI